ncbi:MAG: extracellular solute-binding protein [Chloroflexi bacterium]|nr:extracellular solute-binding protein [Chloroflexota bacterium]
MTPAQKRVRRAVLAGIAASGLAVGGAAAHIALPVLDRFFGRRNGDYSTGPTPVPTAFVDTGPTLVRAAATPTPVTPGKNGTLTFWYSIPDLGKERTAHAAVWQSLREQKGIGLAASSIASTPQHDLEQVLAAAVAAQQPPDIVCVPRYFAGSLSWRQLLTDVSTLARKNSISATQFYPASWAESTLDRQLYGLPFGADARAVWAKISFYAGERNPPFDLNTGPTTLQQLVAAGGKPRPSGNGSLWGYSPFGGENHPYTWGIPFGARWYQEQTHRYVSSASAETTTLGWVQQFLADGRPPQAPGALPPVLTSRLNVLVYSQSLLADLGLDERSPDWKVTPLPNADAPGTAAVWSSGYLLSLASGAKRLEAAWSAIQLYASAASFLIYVRAGGRRVLPALPSLATNKEILKIAPYTSLFLSLLPSAWALPTTSESWLAYRTLGNAAYALGLGAGSPARLFTEADATIDAALRHDGWSG